jgi:hypothetical protein
VPAVPDVRLLAVDRSTEQERLRLAWTFGVCLRGHIKRFNGKRLQCDECARLRSRIIDGKTDATPEGLTLSGE